MTWQKKLKEIQKIRHIVNVNPHHSMVCEQCGWDWKTDQVLDKDMDMKCFCGRILRTSLKEKQIYDQKEEWAILISKLDLVLAQAQKEKDSLDWYQYLRQEGKKEFISELRKTLKEANTND